MNDDRPRDMRTRNKQAIRDAIGEAALRLALEQGPNGLKLVRVTDIAEAAGVATRTYNNYFSSREEAICAIHAAQARRLGTALQSRPAAEPLQDAVVAATVSTFAAPEPDRAGLALIMQTSELAGEALKAFTMAEEPLAAALATRTGSRDELYCTVTAASIAATVRSAGVYWLTAPGSPTFAQVLTSALAHLRLS